MTDTPPPVATKPKRPTWQWCVVLVVFGVVLAVFAIELAARVMRLAPTYPPPDSYYELSGWVGTLPRPYEGFWHTEGDEVKTWVSFNYRSLRDIDHDYTPPPGAQRVMFLGDSYTAGWQVDLGDTYVSRLRDWLNALPGRPTDYDLINAGLHGWGTDREYLFYRQEGYKYQSDLVVLQVYVGNDVLDNGIAVLAQPIPGDRPYFVLDEAGELIYVDYRDPKPQRHPPAGLDIIDQVKWFLRERSYTYHLVRSGVNNLVNALRGIGKSGASAPPDNTDEIKLPMPVDYEIYAPVYDAQWEAAWAITYQLIRALRAEVEAHGGRLAALVVPMQFQEDQARWEYLRDYHEMPADWDPNRPTELFVAFFEREGIPYLDLLPPTLDYIDQTGHWLRFGTPHWTAEGHCVTGALVQNWLLAEALIDGPPGYAPVDPVERCAN